MLPIPQLILASFGLGVVMFGLVHYLSLIPKEKVPAKPIFSLSVMLLGSVIANVPWLVFWWRGGGLSTLLFPFGLVALGLALFFVYLLAQAPMPDQPIKLHVGEIFPDIEVVDSTGQTHHTKDWRGQRFLFKFFRGHW